MMHVQYRTDDDLASRLAARERSSQSSNVIARRDLQRYYALIERELAAVSFEEKEASLICDALNGTWAFDVLSPSQARVVIRADVEDAIRLNGASKKWGVDADKLLATLRDLTDAQALAVLDAVERFWAGTEAGLTVQDVGLADA